MLRKEYEIIWGFVKKPWKKFTLKEIKFFSSKKSQSYVHASLKKFVKLKILEEEKIGNSIVYYIKLNFPKSCSYAGFVAEYCGWNSSVSKMFNSETLFSKMPTKFFVFLVTGSYASGRQHKNSDLDVVIICDDFFEPKRIYAELKHECETSIPQIHLYVFRKSEFIKMLLDSKENYGKEIVRNNLIFFGGGEYFNIIAEAMENGFIG